MFSMDRRRGEIDIGMISRCGLIFGLINTYIDDTQRIVKPIKNWLMIPKTDKIAMVRPRTIPMSPHKRSIFFRYGSKKPILTIAHHQLTSVYAKTRYLQDGLIYSFNRLFQ